jgi:uncharacterized protein (TIGR03435 family)
MMKARLLSAAGIVAMVGGIAVGVAAQKPARLAFAVASVKANKSSGSSGPFALGFLSGGRFTATNVTVQRLIAAAYRMPASRISGGPNWLTSDRFDIQAKTDDPDPSQDVDGVPRQFLMLRGLLADRFRLAVRNEVRELPIYALVLTRSDRKLGPRLHAVTVDCAAVRAASSPTAPPPPPRPDERPPCGIGVRGNSLIAGGATMTQLANALSDRADRIVVDKTNLTGNFDLDLAWTAIPNADPSGSPTIDPGAPPLIFTAIQEQLGLKLESTKGPVAVLVIDHVEHPTED